MAQQHQHIDETGRCSLHPGIQLHHKKKNGEWRVLLNACPLCVSGLPATGQSISTPASRAMAGMEMDQQQQQQQEPQLLVDDGDDDNGLYSRKESKDGKKKKKKKHKHKSPRRRHEDDEEDNNSLADADNDEEHHPASSGEENQRDSENHQQSLLDEKIAKKMQQKKTKKHHHHHHRNKDESTSKSGGRSGSGGRRREKSRTPPAARPRSPSPQSPALTASQQQQSMSRNSNKHVAMANEEGNDYDFTPQFQQDTREKYNEFLQFLDRDSADQQQQQQQEYSSFCHQTSEQDQSNGWDNGASNITQQESIDRSEYSNTEYSAAGTVDHSIADTVSQGAISTEDEGFYTTEDDTSDMDEMSTSHLSRHGAMGNAHTTRFNHQLKPTYQGPASQFQQQQSQYQNVHFNEEDDSSEASNHQFQDTNQQFQNMYLQQKQQQSQQSHNPNSQRQQSHNSTQQMHNNQSTSNRPVPPHKQPSGPLADEVPQRRPDPEDVDEFYQKNNMTPATMYHQHQRQYQAHHMPHSQPRHQVSRGGYNQGGYPPQTYPMQQPVNHPHVHEEEEPYPPHDDTFDDNVPLNDNSSHNGSEVQQQPVSGLLEQDEVSMISMGSVTRNMYKAQAQQLAQKNQQLQENLNEGNESDSSSDSGDETTTNRSSTVESNKQSTVVARNNGEINTCDFDERGWCRRHPTVRLRKKKFMRGWLVVLSNCPECCLDEMRRVKDSRKNARRRKKKGGNSSGSRVSGVSGGSSMVSGNSSRGGDSKSRESRGSRSDRKKRKKKKKKDKKQESKNPPISQVNLRTAAPSNGNDGGKTGREDFDDTHSVGTASTITISSYTHSSGGRWQNYADGGAGNNESGGNGGSVNDDSRSVGSGSMNDNRSIGSGNGSGGIMGNDVKNHNSSSATAHVTRMPYTDHYGEHGWYTGQVDPSTGTPHGAGTMDYANGTVYQGEWSEGVSKAPSKTREEPIMSMGSGGGGFGSSRGGGMPMRRYRQQQSHRHPSHLAGQGGRSYLATLNEDGSSSDYEYAASSSSRSRSSSVPRSSHQRSMSPTPPPSQERKVVCGMSWTDVHGNTGSYTGEVNFLNVPDGMGSMRYDERGGHRGMVAEGMWRDGEMDFDGDDYDDEDSESHSDGGSTYEEEEEDGDVMSASGNSYEGGGVLPSYGMTPGMASAEGGGLGYMNVS